MSGQRLAPGKKINTVAALFDIQLLAMPAIGLLPVALIRAEQRRISAERRECLQREQNPSLAFVTPHLCALCNLSGLRSAKTGA